MRLLAQTIVLMFVANMIGCSKGTNSVEVPPRDYSGAWTTCWPSGEKEEETFKDGLRGGPYRKWDKNGHLIEEGIYASSGPDTFFPNGRIRKWDATGRLVSDEVYEDGSRTEVLYPPKPKPLCKTFSECVVRKHDLNKSVSPGELYFWVDAVYSAHDEKYVRVVIRRGKPIEFFKDHELRAPKDQLLPYHYEWTVLDERGKVLRPWLAYFFKNRDDTYHTVVTQPRNDWARSVLEVYFEDVNGDGVREDVTYKLMLGDILKE